MTAPVTEPKPLVLHATAVTSATTLAQLDAYSGTRGFVDRLEAELAGLTAFWAAYRRALPTNRL